jgi:hypothetical protein
MMNYLPRILSLIIILLIVHYVFSLKTRAVVSLNEVMVQPNQVVELYNSASTSADISSWYIDDAGGSTYFSIPSETVLAPNSCLIFSADYNFNKSSSDTIRLFDNSYPPTSSSARLIDQYYYSKAPDSNYSFSKKMDGGTEWETTTSTLGLLNGTQQSCLPTPTQIPTPTISPIVTLAAISLPTIIPSPTSFPDFQNIYISEIYPYPLPTENEWIEFYNGNEFIVLLKDWYIDDGENSGSTPKIFSIQIEPFSYIVVDMPSSIFNNSGDIVRLLNNQKIEKDSFEYGKIVQGKSIGRQSTIEDDFCIQEPSKNKMNSSCLSTLTDSIQPQIPKLTIKNEKKIPPLKSLNKGASNYVYPEVNNKSKLHTIIKDGDILGLKTDTVALISPIPYLSAVSGLYSLLTIVSLFIKMKNA